MRILLVKVDGSCWLYHTHSASISSRAQSIKQTDRQIDGHRSLKIEEAMLQPHQPFTTQLENETNVDDGDDGDDELKEGDLLLTMMMFERA